MTIVIDAADLPIRRIVEDLQTLNSVLPLAQKHGLTAYDALYLDLAIRRSATLATHDGRLHAAAQAEGLPILP